MMKLFPQAGKRDGWNFRLHVIFLFNKQYFDKTLKWRQLPWCHSEDVSCKRKFNFGTEVGVKVGYFCKIYVPFSSWLCLSDDLLNDDTPGRRGWDGGEQGSEDQLKLFRRLKEQDQRQHTYPWRVERTRKRSILQNSDIFPTRSKFEGKSS